MYETNDFFKNQYYFDEFSYLLKRFRTYACQAYAEIFKDDLYNFYLFAVGGNPKGLGCAAYSQFPAIKFNDWFYGASKRLNNNVRNKKIDRKTVWKDSNLITQLFNARFNDATNKREYLNSLKGQIDVTGIMNITNNLNRNPYLSNILLKNSNCKNIQFLVNLSDDIRNVRNEDEHQKNTTLQTFNEEKYIKTLDDLKMLVNMISSNAVKDKQIELIKEIDNHKQELKYPTISLQKLQEEVPGCDLNALIGVIGNKKINVSKQELYFTDLEQLKKLITIDIKQVTEEKKKITANSKHNFNALSNFANLDKLGKLPPNVEQELIKETSIFIGFETWISNDFANVFAEKIISKFKSANKKIYITKRTRQELSAIANNDFEEKHASAKKALDVMSYFHDKGYVSYIDFHYKGDIQNELLDVSLSSQDIKMVAIMTPIEVMKCSKTIKETQNNNLLPLMFIDNSFFISTADKDVLKAFCGQNQANNKIDLNDNKAAIKTPLKEGNISIKTPSNDFNNEETVYTQSGIEIILGKEIGRGGEGIIYKISDGTVAKIYHKENATQEKFDKLSEMVKLKKMESICLPDSILYNKNKEFIGYTMRRVPKNFETLSASLFKLNGPSKQANPKYKDFDRDSLIAAAINICYNFSRLHEIGMLMGDINPDNILIDIKKPKNPKCYFVDCDSMQFKQFNCPVGQLNYTDPQIYKKYGENPKYNKVTRTLENELYAIAVLLFNILFFNSAPFIGKNNVITKKAMIDYNFPYRNENATGAETPDSCRLIWNNLPSQIKNDFVAVFAEGKYISLEKWIKDLQNYRYLIKNGRFTNELVPHLYWDNEQHEYNEYFACMDCGTEGNMPKERYAMLERKYGAPLKLCNSCYSALKGLEKETATKSNDKKYGTRNGICSECGQMVTFNNYKDAYLRNELHMPIVRCPNCDMLVNVQCQCCGRSFQMRNYKLQQIRTNNQHIYCEDCWKPILATCESCHKIYEIPKWRKLQEENKGHSLLCKECLKERIGN